jgi:AbrB family looped-hinge helix DNA binding protein
MYTATLTSQGQITIPASVRARLDLKPGDQITFSPHTQSSLLLTKSPSIKNLKGLLKAFQRPQESYSEDSVGSHDYKKKWLTHEKNPR